MGSVGVGVGEDEGLEVDLEISADMREAKSMVGRCLWCLMEVLGGGTWWAVSLRFGEGVFRHRDSRPCSLYS